LEFKPSTPSHYNWVSCDRCLANYTGRSAGTRLSLAASSTLASTAAPISPARPRIFQIRVDVFSFFFTNYLCWLFLNLCWLRRHLLGGTPSTSLGHSAHGGHNTKANLVAQVLFHDSWIVGHKPSKGVWQFEHTGANLEPVITELFIVLEEAVIN
jgi:hypothetical protein